MELKRFTSISVLSVFLFLGFVYNVTVFIFIEDWMGLQSSTGSLNALIFTFLASPVYVFSLILVVPHLPMYLMLKKIKSQIKKQRKLYKLNWKANRQDWSAIELKDKQI